MKGPPGPPTPPRPRGSSRHIDDSVETTTPDPDPRKTPRAPPPSVRAMRLLDDEPTTVARDRDKTVVRREADIAASRDLFSNEPAPPSAPPRASPPPRAPSHFAPAPPRAPAPPPAPPTPPPRAVDLFDDDATMPPIEEVSAVLVAAPPAPAAVVAAPPPPVAVAAPPPPAAPPAPLAPLAFATPDDEPPEASVFAQMSLLPCTLRRLLNGIKSNPDPRATEEVAINLALCVSALHDGGAVLGDRLVPENFFCRADRGVEFAQSAEPPPPELAELYRAPELFRAKPPTVQSDVFATAAIVYELLVGRTLKPMFLPAVMQVSRTDTWFSDPGRAMRDAYKVSLRRALADRASQRHPDMRVFADELVRAWRLANNPEARPAEPEAVEAPWRKAVLPGVIVAVFVLIVVGLLLFPVDRIDQPQVPTVRPELTQ